MMLESLYTAMESGFPISDYRYVGMGGNAFYDYIMIHKYLGIRKMISVEHDQTMLERARFNRPYGFVEVRGSTVNDFVASDRFAGNSIFWLDYDRAIRSEVTDDIGAVAVNAKARDFVFVTVCGEPPGFLRKSNGTKRLTELQDRLPRFTRTLTVQDMDDSGFPETVHRILHSAFSHAFSVRGLMFDPFFRVVYADGVRMVTYGGVFAETKECRSFRSRLDLAIPFLRSEPPGAYQIETFNITEKERRLFDLAATARRSNAKELGLLYGLGFEVEELERYRELLRYHPRYVETLL